MNEIERVMTKIHEELAQFREEKASMPTHLILDIGAKQALKMNITAHPFADPPMPDIVKYLGMKVIDLEQVIIVDSQLIEYSELASDKE